MIKKEAGQFVLMSKDGKKKLGTYAKKSEAVRRESQVKKIMTAKGKKK